MRGYRIELGEIESSIRKFEQLDTSPTTITSIGSLVLLEDEEGNQKHVFLGPAAGGMTLSLNQKLVLQVVTHEAPLGKALIGTQSGDEIELTIGNHRSFHEVVQVY